MNTENETNENGIIRLHECFLADPEKRKNYDAFIVKTLADAVVSKKPTNNNSSSPWDARMKEINLKLNKGNEGTPDKNSPAEMNNNSLSPWDARMKEIETRINTNI